MNTSYECCKCLNKQVSTVLDLIELHPSTKLEVYKKLSAKIAELDFSHTPPELMGETLAFLKEFTNVVDPYAQLKKASMDLAQELLAQLKIDNNSFEKDLLLAISGNIIDYGPQSSLTAEFIRESIEKTLACSLDKVLVEQLKNDLALAQNIVYIGDNAGESVFDKYLIEKYFPLDKTTYIVRDAPIINDNALADVQYIALDESVKIASCGLAIPGVSFKDKEATAQFKKIFTNADLIIAKGQGNYESLFDFENFNETGKKANLYFLFMVKCLGIAEISKISLKSPALTYKQLIF